MALGRMTLAPGTVLPAYRTAGPQLLVAERGVLGLEADGESAWVHRGGTGQSGRLTTDLLAAGNGTLLHARSVVTLSGAGSAPVTVLVVSILPIDSVDGAS